MILTSLIKSTCAVDSSSSGFHFLLKRHWLCQEILREAERRRRAFKFRSTNKLRDMTKSRVTRNCWKRGRKGWSDKITRLQPEITNISAVYGASLSTVCVNILTAREAVSGSKLSGFIISSRNKQSSPMFRKQLQRNWGFKEIVAPISETSSPLALGRQEISARFISTRCWRFVFWKDLETFWLLVKSKSVESRDQIYVLLININKTVRHKQKGSKTHK